MKRSVDNRTDAGRLPSFLDEPDASAADATTADETHPDAAGSPESEPTATTAASYDEQPELLTDADDATDDATLDGADELEPEPLDDTALAGPTATRRTTRNTLVRGAPSGTVTTLLGAALLVAAIGAAMAPSAAAALQSAGFAPGALFAVGAIVAAIGVVQRRTSQLQQRLEASLTERRAADDELRGSLAELLGTGRSGTPAEGDLQHVLLALQRQDQKINNLTKAIKMYGKPLMEIASQGTELAGSVAQVRTLVEGGSEAMRQGVTRIENELRARTGKSDLGQLPQQIGRVEVAIAAVAQRLEHNELHKSLVRIEDSTHKAHSELQQLLRGESVRKVADDLQHRIDQTAQGLANGIRELRDGNLGTLENAVRDIQREVAGLATSVAQIQAAVRNGARAPAPPPAPATQPTPAAQTPAAATASSRTPDPTPPAAAAPAANGGADGAGYQTGKRKSTGKNVLGAIAKLKQMKS